MNMINGLFQRAWLEKAKFILALPYAEAVDEVMGLIIGDDSVKALRDAYIESLERERSTEERLKIAQERCKKAEEALDFLLHGASI